MTIRIIQNPTKVSLQSLSELESAKSAVLANTAFVLANIAFGVFRIIQNPSSKPPSESTETDKIISERSSSKANEPKFAAKHLVGGEELAPYFAPDSKQVVAAAVALAVITIFIITKSGKDPADTQFPIDLENTQVSGLNINQLLEIRENSLNK